MEWNKKKRKRKSYSLRPEYKKLCIGSKECLFTCNLPGPQAAAIQWSFQKTKKQEGQEVGEQSSVSNTQVHCLPAI